MIAMMGCAGMPASKKSETHQVMSAMIPHRSIPPLIYPRKRVYGLTGEIKNSSMERENFAPKKELATLE